MNFMVVKSMSPYNGIIGRPGLKAIQAVPSTVNGMLKFLVKGGIATIRSTILIPTECALVTTSSVIPREKRTCPANFIVALHPDFPDQGVVIGGSLSDKGRTELCSILKKNIDIFSWQPSDMTEAPERARAIQAEVQKLVDAGSMREVYYHDWLSNPVMVKKHYGSWRMCVDFTDLNKACPQDCYPLPEIDWKVESLCGYPFKCFLDAYKGYHQIQLVETDEEKTSFHTRQGVYCYNKIPFGLKNAGATYQRLMDKAFKSQVGRNIEVYVDDLVVKSHTEDEMVREIEETFRTLRKVNMKLNPKKCSFRLAGVFLGETSFQAAKAAFVRATLLVSPKPQEELIMYLSATYGAISAVLMTKRGTTQTPIYFISRALQGPELNYSPMEKLVLSLVFAAKRLRCLRPLINEAEYEALVAGLRIATQMGVKNVQVNVDSKLVANQVLGMYVAKEEYMIKYLEIVKGLVSGFTTYSISQVPQSKNKKADALSKTASTSFAHLSKQVLVEVLENKSIKEKEVAAVIEEDGPTWMTQFVDYLKEVVLPGDKKEARKLRLKARSCSMHAGPRSVVAKAVRLGYYWPTMHKDARDMIQKCNDCQIHLPVTRPLSERAEEGQVPDSRHGLLHEVDRSKGGGNDYRRAKIRMPTYRSAAVDVVNNDEELRLNLDFLKERQKRAAICEAKAKSKMMKYYNARVCGVAFKLGDFVYRSNDASHAVVGGKLGPKWEGPYEVTEALGNGAYKLWFTDGTVLPRTWNVTNLKRCYL
uniref:Reverse transcriptase domain-containing protein n=1 Tax=Tanacetum cinerariifolium TaxID=118510 RepID=A0A699H951_TANCI|nr:reverse transcriptase domain-containing protein [Tanacetum cinerariifolium]